MRATTVYWQLICEYLEKFGAAKRIDINKLLLEKLPDQSACHSILEISINLAQIDHSLIIKAVKTMLGIGYYWV